MENGLPRKEMVRHVQNHLKKMLLHFKQAFSLMCLTPDSIGTKFGGRPGSKAGGKRPFKPYNNTEKKGRPGKARDFNKKEYKSGYSKAGQGLQGKRKLPAAKNEEDDAEGEKILDWDFFILNKFLTFKTKLTSSLMLTVMNCMGHCSCCCRVDFSVR